MIISKLKLTNFRNYSNCYIEFNKGINNITGINGSGKTNIVEAINYLTLGKSFKTSDDKTLIKFDEEYAKIEIELFKKEKINLKAVISKEGKKISYNDIELKKLSALSGKLITILFTPEDASFFKDSPLSRRKFLDINISNINNDYLKELLLYKNLLKERNALLKQENVDSVYLSVIENRMVDPQFKIIQHRKKIINDLNKILKNDYKKIDDEEVELKIKYHTFSNDDNYESFKENLLNKYKENFEQDLKRKSTSIGIHHDDIEMYRNGREINLYGSQGQNRIAVLALKISMLDLLKERIHDEPIVILDDVLSELDKEHQTKLIECLKEFEQVFITCAKDEIDEIDSTIYVVKDNLVIRR